jgi:hypothetical protein
MKAVQNGKHGNKRHYTEKDPEYGEKGNKRDKVITPLGAGVTKADEEFQGLEHGTALNHIRAG